MNTNIGIGLLRVLILFFSFVLWVCLFPLFVLASMGSAITKEKSQFELYYQILSSFVFYDPDHP